MSSLNKYSVTQTLNTKHCTHIGLTNLNVHVFLEATLTEKSKFKCKSGICKTLNGSVGKLLAPNDQDQTSTFTQL